MIFFLSTYLSAQITTSASLDSIQNEFSKQAEAIMQEYNQYAQKVKEEYEKYEAQARADYMNYVKRVQTVWGSDSMIDNTKHTWVEYGPNMTDRSVVNFETGEIEIEVVVDEGSTEAETNKALEKAVTRLLESRGSTCPYPSSVDESKPITKEPILNDLVDLTSYDLSQADSMDVAVHVSESRKSPAMPSSTVKDLNLNFEQTKRTTQQKATHKAISEKNSQTIHKHQTLAQKKIEEKKKAETLRKQRKMEEVKRRLAQIIVKQTSKETLPLVASKQSSNTLKKKIVKLSMRLVAENLSKNAALYKDIVTFNSKRFNIEEPLIYAVMEQESSFNPQAASWVPAYGLMQLVPRSGGFEAYKYVYHTEWIPTRSYLFVPQNNIELGTAYLRVLMNQFASVEDPECRRLCVIASYNTGAGNVSRSFTGNRRLGQRTLSLINQYDYKGLFNYLTTNLNTSEARNYVRGVSRRRAKYL